MILEGLLSLVNESEKNVPIRWMRDPQVIVLPGGGSAGLIFLTLLHACTIVCELN